MYLDEGNAMLLAQSSDQLLVHWLITVLGQDAEQGLPLVQGLGGLPHTSGQTVSNQSLSLVKCYKLQSWLLISCCHLLEHFLDGGVDIHGAGGDGGGGWNIISLNIRHGEFLDVGWSNLKTSVKMKICIDKSKDGLVSHFSML